MSRTVIYKMMENKKIDLLPLGSYAIEAFSNGAGLLESLSENKLFLSKDSEIVNDISSLADFGSPAWMMEFESDEDSFYAEDSIKVKDTYSLDDILDGKPVSSPTSSSVYSVEFIDTPVASPLSSSDELSYDLDDLLAAASPENVLASKQETCSVPLAEHMYAVTPVTIDSSPAVLSPISIDSGLDSADEASLGSDQDILMQFLNGDFDNAVLQFSNEQIESSEMPDLSMSNSNELHLSSLMEQDYSWSFDIGQKSAEEISNGKVRKSNSTGDIKFSPYKKKTPEQRKRKKTQNRNAALRYRNKKKEEMTEMTAEADELEVKNKDLKDKVGGLKKEIDYLKNLMLDVIKARLANGKQNVALDTALNSLIVNTV